MSERTHGSAWPVSVLVTGAASGIGLATALQLAREGRQVIGTARSEEKADALVRNAHAQGLTLDAVVMDLTDPASCQEAVARAASLTNGGPHALVANAGMPLTGGITDLPEDRIREVLEVNVVGTLRMCTLVLPAMRRRGRGWIVIVSSAGARIPSPMNGWYTASKHALSAATHSLRMETRRHGVRVVLVEPGTVATPFWDRAQEDLSSLSAGLADADVLDRASNLFSRIHQSAGGPQPVARTITKALVVPRPRRRYTVGVDAHLGAALQCAAPLWLSDQIKTRLSALHTPVAAAPTRVGQASGS
ncbi:SDR family NAD(P)-dependent oxidoreductase [Streptomyces sp. NBC_00239]|uniref:SDR family NAD(P)-dependent oxidoreductase n=1 Tax=Streptomyces sp. NBC_00239 TaxID=2903640 RepID=UPI002E292663|nr:SDR family NAD(P)-dependent oxidoreductase [Streptomyces sp. NBC_00239]